LTLFQEGQISSPNKDIKRKRFGKLFWWRRQDQTFGIYLHSRSSASLRKNFAVLSIYFTEICAVYPPSRKAPDQTWYKQVLL